MRTIAELRVRYGDTDAMGVVYYANYLRYLEVARVEYFRQMGQSYRAVEDRGMVVAVTEVACRYHASARFDDLLTLCCGIVDLRRASFAFQYEVLLQPSNQLLLTGRTVHACLQKPSLRPVRIPDTLRQAIEAFEAPSP